MTGQGNGNELPAHEHGRLREARKNLSVMFSNYGHYILWIQSEQYANLAQMFVLNLKLALVFSEFISNCLFHKEKIIVISE